MTTVYKSTQITSGNPARFDVAGNFDVYGSFSLTAALIINDTIQMCKVPAGARILDMELYCDDLDTNGSPTITFDIGDSLAAARFASAITLPQVGGFMRGIQTKAGFCYVMTIDDIITILVKAAPATGTTSGDILMRVTCCVDN